MTAKELAALLNGRSYGSEISKQEAAKAKADGLVVVYGASDDLMEFDGAISDELDAYDGTTAYLDAKGLLHNECENSECPHFLTLQSKSATIKAVWHNDGEYTWTIETDIPHETFEIFDEGEKFCCGLVFALSDVKVTA